MITSDHAPRFEIGDWVEWRGLRGDRRTGRIERIEIGGMGSIYYMILPSNSDGVILTPFTGPGLHPLCLLDRLAGL